MPRILPVFVRRAVAAVAAIVIGHDDEMALGDALQPGAELPETVGFGDEEVNALALGEALGATDTNRPSTALPEQVQVAEQGRIDLTEWRCPRSGSPDADPWGDAWVNEAVGQTGVNHGNETPLRVVNTALSRRFGFLKFDLRKLSGLTGQTAAGSGLRLFCGNTSAVAAVTLTLFFERRSDDASPFTESTLTWANRPTGLTALFSKTLIVPVNSSGPLTVALAKADVDAMVGHFVCVRIESDNLTQEVTVRSREAATDTERPTLALKLQTT